MARLFGFIANRPDLISLVATSAASLLDERATGAPLGWGVGFYQGGEVLLLRRPVDERATVPVAEALRELRTDALVGQVRRATVGSMTTENTHPFRYRQWLFAHTGTVAGFPPMRERLADSIPQFLRRNVRGDTDSELLFYLFLSFLHDAGKLSEAVVAPADIRGALRSTVALVDRLSREEGVEPSGFNMLVTDGEHVVAVHGEGEMHTRVIEGRRDLDELLGEEGLGRGRPADRSSARVSMVVSEGGGDMGRFTPVPARAIITLSRVAPPAVEPLDSVLRRRGRRVRRVRRRTCSLPHDRPLAGRETSGGRRGGRSAPGGRFWRTA